MGLEFAPRPALGADAIQFMLNARALPEQLTVTYSKRSFQHRGSKRPTGGQHTVVLPLLDETAARIERFAMVLAFMIWRAASGFVKQTKLIAPDAIAPIAVTRDEVSGALRITRIPIGFAESEWFGRESVGDEIVSLLPSRSLALSENETRFIDQAFVRGSIPGIQWVRPGE